MEEALGKPPVADAHTGLDLLNLLYNKYNVH